MLNKTVLMMIAFALCIMFVASPAMAKDRLRTMDQDRLMTCDQFIDMDNDGICDNCGCIDADGDGVCDECPCGDQTRTGR